jgi:hypothetical protein
MPQWKCCFQLTNDRRFTYGREADDSEYEHHNLKPKLRRENIIRARLLGIRKID